MTSTAVTVVTDADDLPQPMVDSLLGGIPKLAAILGNEDEARRALTNAVVAIQREPKLLKADPQSFMLAVVQVAQWGLEVGMTAHLVPFYSTKLGKTLVTAMKNFRGVITLAIAAKGARSIEAHAVYEGERFEVEYGTSAHILHVPDFGKRTNSVKLTHVYAIAHIGIGIPPKFIVLSRTEVEDYRAMSKFKDSTFWRDHYPQMAKKTAVHRLGDLLPQSPRLAQAFQDGEAQEEARTLLALPTPAPEAPVPSPAAPVAPEPAPAPVPTAPEPPAPAGPASRAVTGKVMPIGPHKDEPLTQLTDKYIASVLVWIAETPQRAQKFAELTGDLKAEQKARTLVRPGKEVPEQAEEVGELEGDDLSLLF